MIFLQGSGCRTTGVFTSNKISQMNQIICEGLFINDVASEPVHDESLQRLALSY